MDRPGCERKVSLSKALVAAAEQLALTTSRLDARIGVAPREEYNVLRSSVERAHLVIDDAHDALISHIAKHGC
jgi:hypothetical protein